MPSIGEHLVQAKGQLGRLLAQADELVRLNRLLHGYLPPQFRGHALLAALYPDAWIIQTDSSTWATRLRYALPNLHRQLSDHLGREIPKLRIRIRPPQTGPLGPPRRLTVTPETAATLETAAHNVSDPRLSMAMKRLAEHARKRVA